MINFENLTVEQMKEYLLPGELQKLEPAELGQLVSVSRSLCEYFAKNYSTEAIIEITFWKAAEEAIKQEFSRRNIDLKVIKLTELYEGINHELKRNYREMKAVLIETFSHFEMPALLDLKQELLEIPGHEQKLGLVLKVLDEYLGTGRQNAYLN